MSKLAERVQALSAFERRQLFGFLGAALAAPWVSPAARFAARALAVNEAYAQDLEETTFFLEVDLREQADLMHVMVPPSIARYPNRSVGVNGNELVMFAGPGELTEHPNQVFLTADSQELAPHVADIAMIDLGEPGIGSIHGHEAANGMRSPGRVMDQGATGLAPLWLLDGEHAATSEELYGAVPTPATLHNYYQKRLRGGALNGFAFKGISTRKASVYHYGAGLEGAELTRVQGTGQLFAQYGAGLPSVTPPSLLAREIMDRAGAPYRSSNGPGYDALVEDFRGLRLADNGSLELSPEEVAYWSRGVPPQQCDSNNFEFFDCPLATEDSSRDRVSRAQIWEQFAYASKLMRLGRARSIALEFDFPDLEGDGARTELSLRYQAQQVARPLARFISDMKAAGLFERTVIAVYTLDGSRRPNANSYGDDGKNSLILAGGRVRGGYYGDISITKDLPQGGHEYGFNVPDPDTGALLPTVTNWRDRSKRLPSGSAWRTVMKAAKIPESEYVGKFHFLVDQGKALSFMLRG